jgi:hypothetical protein
VPDVELRVFVGIVLAAQSATSQQQQQQLELAFQALLHSHFTQLVQIEINGFLTEYISGANFAVGNKLNLILVSRTL